MVNISKNKEISGILDSKYYLETLFKRLLNILPSFNITDEKILPYGLKAHTRSVSWLVEQVIVQQTKFKAKELGITGVNFDLPDTCLHDCEIYNGGKKYYVNIKIHNVAGKENKNDISAVEKLYFQYTANEKYNLIYACFGIRFENVHIHFDPDYLILFSPQFMPIYVNPRNDKIQATYHHAEILRTRADFLKLLKKNSRSITLM
ncbi:MAG: hypothetical protein A2749_01475 [Parcubacteria group bacterium RIFCSPHIGHO2_01_FULL_45_26]|nr:MAG: hypothetical protein A2749_01475 [Parcubacteria group bacterium RIFCSPHIGHO2_01_FULL_45_26]